MGRQAGETFWERNQWNLESKWLWEIRQGGVRDDFQFSDLSKTWCHLLERKDLSSESPGGCGEDEIGEFCFAFFCLKYIQVAMSGGWLDM